MVALATAPRDTVCTHCGRTTLDGATFARWRKTCTDCHKAQKREYMDRQRATYARAADQRPPRHTDPGGTALAYPTPVHVVYRHLGPCPRVAERLDLARDYWRTLARVAREMGYADQAADWETLAGQEVSA